MNKLNASQKSLVRSFMGVAEKATEKQAIEVLKATGWNAEAAFEHYYATYGQSLPQSVSKAPAARGKALDAKALEAGFQKYKAEHVEAIQADGVSRFCEDLGVDPGDVAVLVIAYHFKAERMFEFSKAEWMQGMTALGVDTVPKLAALLGTLRSSLSSADTFRDVYAYAFAFGLERGAKVLVADTAVGLWSILLPGRWHAADAWMAYVSALPALKVVSKDTWMQTLEFIRTIKPDLSNFDENAAWPTLLDDFVDSQKAAAPQE